MIAAVVMGAAAAVVVYAKMPAPNDCSGSTGWYFVLPVCLVALVVSIPGRRR